MLKPEDINRPTLAQWRIIAKHLERRPGPCRKMARAARYSAAVYATDLNGGGCRFPACACPDVDCSQRPDTPGPVVWPSGVSGI